MSDCDTLHDLQHQIIRLEAQLETTEKMLGKANEVIMDYVRRDQKAIDEARHER